MYTCKYFWAEEWVPPDVYTARGEKSWQLLDDRSLITADAIRKRYGKMIINNWKWITKGPKREWSGLRTEDSPVGSRFSQHRFGRAFDAIMLDVEVEEVRLDILNNTGREEYKYIKGLELNINWLHIDVRNSNRLQTFTP